MAPFTEYRWIQGPVGEMLRSSSLATTATVPLQGHLVVTTGHVGVDLKSGQLVQSSIVDEFHAIFNCLDAALQDAGVKTGLAGAHKVVAYFTRAEDEATMLELFRGRYPGHSPTWTSVVVAGLVVPGMHAEVQAEAVRFD
ncbi:endoribonuclease l-psp family protein [Colletotrichum truncatum]|uniref:Endoribonuclease l-psp family protein n=1 Tax=Colletotrichum truncatum TaxID=5467 RepID=A0ACC3Z3E3_COLTU|nr:endoribonuclease l-psp family protein [Colletotrichum truncatum]XP_036585427.1 endoribonuclease l-psp family protein [Colletotrichum truncatum]KAF6780682.1 endoribonuclease l-psp family protein [Colletotrichum truncatum]KAF6795478.1 endoribonuclease l-psp family protein [Colletotrichum truncatum]